MLSLTVYTMRALTALLLAVLVTTACSPKRMGINRMADALSSTASAFGRDDDPEFVRAAAPSTLKMVEMLLDQQPDHAGLLLTACSGFTQYAYGFLHSEADLLPAGDTARQLRSRATRMYDRARGYCLRWLELRHAGFGAALARDAKAAVAVTTAADVPGMYWFAAAGGASIAAAENPLLRIADVATVRLVLARALTLDEDWENGALHEAMIAIEGMPVLLGGSAERARSHFRRAVELSKGQSAFAYLAMASSVAQPARDRKAFEELLRTAVSIDTSKTPSLRLANLIAQRRARYLLERVSTLF